MALSLARGDTFTVAFTAAVAFAIGALPENLPAVVTTILASSTQALVRVGAIMKRPLSTEPSARPRRSTQIRPGRSP
jgi:P-type Ca2+ transporter type 2C